MCSFQSLSRQPPLSICFQHFFLADWNPLLSCTNRSCACHVDNLQLIYNKSFTAIYLIFFYLAVSILRGWLCSFVYRFTASYNFIKYITVILLVPLWIAWAMENLFEKLCTRFWLKTIPPGMCKICNAKTQDKWFRQFIYIYTSSSSSFSSCSFILFNFSTRKMMQHMNRNW